MDQLLDIMSFFFFFFSIFEESIWCCYLGAIGCQSQKDYRGSEKQWN